MISTSKINRVYTNEQHLTKYIKLSVRAGIIVIFKFGKSTFSIRECILVGGGFDAGTEKLSANRLFEIRH